MIEKDVYGGKYGTYLTDDTNLFGNQKALQNIFRMEFYVFMDAT